MSFTDSGDFPKPNAPNDPLNFAPRSVRSRASPQTKPVRPTSSRSGFDEMLTDAVAKSRPHPLDPEFVRQPEQPRARFSVASRLAVAVGVVAIIGVSFFMMIPKSQGSDPTSDGAAKASDDSQALLQKFVQFEKSKGDSSAGAAQTSSDDSKMLLQKFMQWQQKQQ
jgi:predicted component of type VI protein secretion system